MLTQRQRAGQRAEELAASFLSTQGWEILGRNVRWRLGELDLVARRDGVLVIAEVRTRTDTRYGSAAASIDRRKQQRIVRASRLLLQQRRDLARLPVRFDVIVVTDLEAANPGIEWIRDAFEAG